MKKHAALVKRPPTLDLRAAQFEDVAATLRLVGRSIAFACRDHYDAAQRAAVYETYAAALFVDAVGPFEAVAAEVGGRLVGFAQLDATSGRLRALFVDADCQGRGVGRALLGEIEARAARRGCARLHGAMALNAVPFYERAGFRACGGEERLASTGVPIPIVRMEKILRA